MTESNTTNSADIPEEDREDELIARVYFTIDVLREHFEANEQMLSDDQLTEIGKIAIESASFWKDVMHSWISAVDEAAVGFVDGISPNDLG